MERHLIAKINGSDIYAVSTDEGIFVPVKPICTAIGIDFKSQYDKLQNDEILSSTMVLSTTVGSDEKSRDMVSLPLRYIYGWLFTINPKNVNPEAKESVIKYRNECYDVLYDHFTSRLENTIRINNEEIKILQEYNDSLVAINEAKAHSKELKSKLDQIRASRLNPVPSLFD